MATSANDGMDIDNNLDAEGTDAEIIADAVANAATAASDLAGARAVVAAHEASVTGHTRKTYSLAYTRIHQSALTLVANADAATALAAAAATTRPFRETLSDEDKSIRSLSLATKKGWKQANGSPWDVESITAARAMGLCFKCGTRRTFNPGTPPFCPRCPADR
eukprot:gene5673-1656_t